MFTRCSVLALVVFIGAFVTVAAPSPAPAAERLVSLGTAGVTGVYYPAGGAICRLVNRGRKDHNIRCMVESTGGSISNLEGLRAHELDFGLVQSDWLYHAYNGSEVFKDQGENKDLRVLFALHSEPFTILTRAGSGIKSFADLKGKRVNMGTPGAGMKTTIEELMRIKGMEANSFKITPDLKMQDQAQALCSGKTDAIIYALGHPNAAVQQITSMCDARIIGFSGAEVDQFIKQHPFYGYTTIPGGIYLHNKEPIKTFGVKAVLVANKDLDDDVAYEITKSVFANLDNFKTLHPVFSTLDAEHMAGDVRNIAPFHPGALRYLKESGLLKESN
jgi:uncharacterized protein